MSDIFDEIMMDENLSVKSIMCHYWRNRDSIRSNISELHDIITDMNYVLENNDMIISDPELKKVFIYVCEAILDDFLSKYNDQIDLELHMQNEANLIFTDYMLERLAPRLTNISGNIYRRVMKNVKPSTLIPMRDEYYHFDTEINYK